MAGDVNQELAEMIKQVVARIAEQVAREVVKHCLMDDQAKVLTASFRLADGNRLLVGMATTVEWNRVVGDPAKCQEVLKVIAEAMLAMDDKGNCGQEGRA